MITMLSMANLLSRRTTYSPMVMGVCYVVLSNLLFGVLYVYGKWLQPLTGTDVFLWRMVMMWLCLMGFLSASGKIKQVWGDIKAIQGMGAWVWLLLPTPIFASQLWLFMWAPLNAQGVQVSMGYFLFPLAMVLVGILLGERLSKLQWLAVILALLGVITEIVRVGQISIATFWVCLTYPIYYVMRRKQGVRALTGLTLDVSLIAPVCLVVLLFFGSENWSVVTSSWGLIVKVFGLGMISVLALQLNLEANRLLPTSLFGMLGYLEPALLFVLAITVLGGAFTMGMFVSFGLIWLGIGCLLVQGVLKYRH